MQELLPTATHPVIDKISSRTGQQKSLPQLTHLRGGIYAPQMEEFRQGKNPAVYLKTAGCRGGLGGNVRVSFLATSWETPRSGINMQPRSAKQYARPKENRLRISTKLSPRTQCESPAAQKSKTPNKNRGEFHVETRLEHDLITSTVLLPEQQAHRTSPEELWSQPVRRTP
jgi:hypothetical protein